MFTTGLGCDFSPPAVQILKGAPLDPSCRAWGGLSPGCLPSAEGRCRGRDSEGQPAEDCLGGQLWGRGGQATLTFWRRGHLAGLLFLLGEDAETAFSGCAMPRPSWPGPLRMNTRRRPTAQKHPPPPCQNEENLPERAEASQHFRNPLTLHEARQAAQETRQGQGKLPSRLCGQQQALLARSQAAEEDSAVPPRLGPARL